MDSQPQSSAVPPYGRRSSSASASRLNRRRRSSTGRRTSSVRSGSSTGRRYQRGSRAQSDAGSVTSDGSGRTGQSSLVERHLHGIFIKRWFYRVPLLVKMIGIIGIPLVCALVLGGLYLSDSFTAVQTSSNSVKLAQFSDPLFSFYSSAQKERSLTYIYGRNRNAGNKLLLEGARNVTSLARTTFIGAISQLPAGVAQYKDAKSALDLIAGLDRQRQLFDGGLLALDPIMDYYQDMILSTVDILNLGYVVTTNSGAADEMEDARYLAIVADYIRLEMMLGAEAITNNAFTSEAMLTKYTTYVASQIPFEAILKYSDNRNLITTSSDEEIVVVNRMLTDVATYRTYLIGGQFYRFNGNSTDYTAAMELVYEYRIKQINILVADVLSAGTADKAAASKDQGSVIGILCSVLGLTSFLIWLLVDSIQETNRILRKEVDRRKRTESAIWRFFPHEFMTLLNQSEVLGIQSGDRRRMRLTILSADIRNFTRTSECLGPEKTYEWLTDYYRAVGPAITQNNGFIDKTMGDGVVAVFTDAKDAMQAALRMQVCVEQLNSERALQNLTGYQIGVGLHSGEGVVGVVGDETRLQGSIVSDTVTISGKLEALTKVYGSRIIASESIISECANMADLHYRLVGLWRPSEKSDPLMLYDVYQVDPLSVFRFKDSTKSEYERSVRLFMEKKFEDSIQTAERALVGVPTIQDLGLEHRIAVAKTMLQSGIPDNWKGEDDL